MISAIATIQDGSCRCVHFDFDESTSWDALNKRLSAVLGTPMPFTVSYLDDEGEDIAITGAEWPTTSASAASSNNFLVLNVTPGAPEAPKEEQSQSRSQVPHFGGHCGNGFGGFGFPFAPNFAKVQEAMNAMGLEQGDVQKLLDNFLTGAPLPEEKAKDIARGLSALTGRPEEAVAEHVKRVYSKGQDIASHCKEDVEAFAANARAYAASVAEAAAQAEIAANDAEKQAKERAEAEERVRAVKAKAAKVAQARATASSTVRHPAKCDVCKRGIVGVRMKCLNCEDYDMCEACEQRNIVEQYHPDGHVFAKIYKPSLLRFAEPFPNLYEMSSNHRRAAAAARRQCSPNGPATACIPELFFRPASVAVQPKMPLSMEERAKAAEERAKAAEEAQQKIINAKREWTEKRRAAAQAAASSEDSRLASLEQKLLQLTQALAEEKAARERATFA